jgi:hypothetical protein
LLVELEDLFTLPVGSDPKNIASQPPSILFLVIVRSHTRLL